MQAEPNSMAIKPVTTLVSRSTRAIWAGTMGAWLSTMAISSVITQGTKSTEEMRVGIMVDKLNTTATWLGTIRNEITDGFLFHSSNGN